ncbi:MAG TPA: single-stranded-DNA-specific exonuclease RecJ [Candidatus Brocadiia bacterium]|nr:single-stranded-DNA-specific exonuclease RecJ [Candidatus Brocadiales bacterium]
MDKKWVFLPSNRKLQEEIASSLHISPITAQLIINRGITDVSTAKSFLQPQLSTLGDPMLLPDMDKAAKRIVEAVRNGEKITVYGDYDADGVSATALMVLCLNFIGANVQYYIPERIEEGYGLNRDAILRLKSDGTSIIITVDCGINSYQEARTAQLSGIDLIITDHHEPGAEIPDAFAIINPKLTHRLSPIPHFPSPITHLSGVGVAFKLAWAIGQHLSLQKRVSPEFRDFLTNALGLVALGTISDVVPLYGENRILTRHGLEYLQHCDSPGIKALIEVADLCGSSIESSHVGYRLGPRLNVAGRIDSAGICVELLTTKCENRAREIAKILDNKNKKRQEIQQAIAESVREKIEKEIDMAMAHVIILSDESWHPGVVGIVASKVAEEFNRPTIIIAVDGQLGHGSARSYIPSFHLFKALELCRERLITFGGHARAAGLKILRHEIDEFKALMNATALQLLQKDDFIPTLQIDAEVKLNSLSKPLMDEFARLYPHGEGNPLPLFAATNVKIVGQPRRVGAQGQHLSFYVRQGDTTFKAIAFGMGEEFECGMRNAECGINGKLYSIAFTPKLNNWMEQEGIELEVKDIKFAPASPPLV